jgi:hypothetical protein
MQARNETMGVDRDEAKIGQAEPTTRGRTPRFKLIKLEERIAPGGLVNVTSQRCTNTATMPTRPTNCTCF